MPNKDASNPPAATGTATTTARKSIPRIVDDSTEEREPVVKIQVKEATFDSAQKFITKALVAAGKDPYNGVTIKGTLSVFAAEE